MGNKRKDRFVIACAIEGTRIDCDGETAKPLTLKQAKQFAKDVYINTSYEVYELVPVRKGKTK